MQQIVTAIPRGASIATLPCHEDRFFGYGLGLISEHDKKFGQFISHSGGYPGFSSHMRWHAPTGLGVVVLENATYSGAAQTATGLIDQVLDDIGFQLSVVDVWTMTKEKARQANLLIQQWDDELASQIFEEIVILDIPFDERRKEIERLSSEEGLTILLTTHYLEEADRLAGQLAIVDEGKVVAQGSPDELKSELRGDAVHVELGETETDGRVAAALAQITEVHDVVVDEGRLLHARADNGARAVPVVLQALEAHGVSVASVTVARPSLDDVYLMHTGRRFEQADKAAEVTR